jgi:hypothetical protein
MLVNIVRFVKQHEAANQRKEKTARINECYTYQAAQSFVRLQQ